MMDNEDVFTITPTSTNRKIFSFQNPLARRINTENSLQTPTEHNTNIELAKANPRCSFSTKYFFIILLIIILTGIIITLAIFYIQCKEQHITTGSLIYNDERKFRFFSLSKKQHPPQLPVQDFFVSLLNGIQMQ